jgi:hypothetical protein
VRVRQVEQQVEQHTMRGLARRGTTSCQFSRVAFNFPEPPYRGSLINFVAAYTRISITH